MTATDLKKRAISLAEKTKIDSVTPEEVGQLSNDIVEYIENVEINGSSLGIRKTYTSVSAMEADSTAPKDDKGVLLRRGMLVNIYNQEDPDSADNGKVFSFQNPGWAFRGTVDAGYATKEELTELSNNVGLYNVDKNVPLGSGFYTSTTARAAVPTSVRKLGLIITYKTDATTSVTEQFVGSAVSGWGTDSNWKNVGSEGGNKILQWNTDAATTRNQVPLKERKQGMKICYKNESGQFVNEQFIGSNITDSYFGDSSFWVNEGENESNSLFVSKNAVLQKTLELSDFSIAGALSKTVGHLVSNSTYGKCTDYIECNAYNNYKGSFLNAPTVGKDYYGVAFFYDKDKKYLGFSTKTSDYNAKAKFTRFYSDLTVSNPSVQVYNLADVSQLIDNNVSEISSNIKCYDFEQAEFTKNGYYSTAGVFNDDPRGNSKTTDFLEKGSVGRVYVNSKIGLAVIALWDKSKKFIKCLNSSADSKVFDIADLSNEEYSFVTFSVFSTNKYHILFFEKKNKLYANQGIYDNDFMGINLLENLIGEKYTYEVDNEYSKGNKYVYGANIMGNGNFVAPFNLFITRVRIKVDTVGCPIVLGVRKYNSYPYTDPRVTGIATEIRNSFYEGISGLRYIGDADKSDEFIEFELRKPYYVSKDSIVYAQSLYGSTYANDSSKNAVGFDYYKCKVQDERYEKNKCLFNSKPSNIVLQNVGWTLQDDNSLMYDGTTQYNRLIYPICSSIHNFVIRIEAYIYEDSNFLIGKVSGVIEDTLNFNDSVNTFLIQDGKIQFSRATQDISLKTGKVIISIEQTITDTPKKSVKFSILDYNSLQEVSSVTFDSDTANLSGFLYIRHISGSQIKVYNAEIGITGEYPDIIFYSDSIGEGAVVTKANSYACMLRSALKEKGIVFVNSSTGGENVTNIINRLFYELPILKPKYAMFTIGVNGNGTYKNYKLIAEVCIENGVIPLINHILAVDKSYRDYEEVNSNIDRVVKEFDLIPSAKLDIATSVEYDLSQGPAFELHPIEEGHIRCFNRIKADYPFLF